MQPVARSITSENASREEAAQQHSSAHTARLAVGVSRLSALLQVCFLLAVLTFSWPASPAAAQAPDGQTPGEMASPQAAVWTSYPIFGGNMTSMASDPNNGQGFYVGTEFAGVFKTTDAGASWQPARSGLPASARVISLRVDPRNSSIVYAGTDTDGILWKAMDAGATWANITHNMQSGTFVRAYKAFNILVDPQNSDVVYVGLGGSAGQIYKTTDGGATWWVMDSGIPRDNGNYAKQILALAIDPDQPSVLYAGGPSFGVYKTTDGGATWTALNEGVPMYRNEYKTVTSLAVDPLHGNRPVGVIDGRYFTFGTDNRWSPVGTSTSVFSSYDHVHLYLHPTDPNIIYGADRVIQKSTDGGMNWIMLNDSSTGESPDMAFHRSAPNTLLAANQRGWGGNMGGVRKSLNGGANWINASTGITAQPIQGVAIDPQNPDNLYSGLSSGSRSGVWHSTDRGLTWQFTVTDGEVMDIAVDPRDSTRIYVAAYYLLVSSDQGASFLTVPNSYDYGITSIAATADASNPVYAGGRGGVYKSSDSGLTWLPKNNGIPTTSGGDVAHIMSLAVDPNNPSILWAGTDDEGLVKSTNAGESWQVKGFVDVPDVDAVAVKPGNSNTILVGTGDYRGSGGRRGEIHKSIDGGQTWQLKYRGTSTITDFVYDPRNSNWIYASTAYLPNISPHEGGEGVLRSFDGGEHWSSYSSGLFNPAIFSLAIGPDDPPLLLAGTMGSGLYGTLPPRWKPVFLPLVMR